MIHRIDCVTGLEPSDAMSRIRDAIGRVEGRIADQRRAGAKGAAFSFNLPDDRFEDLLDGLPELAVYVERASSPERVRFREIRCRLALVFSEG